MFSKQTILFGFLSYSCKNIVDYFIFVTNTSEKAKFEILKLAHVINADKVSKGAKIRNR